MGGLGAPPGALRASAGPQTGTGGWNPSLATKLSALQLASSLPREPPEVVAATDGERGGHGGISSHPRGAAGATPGKELVPSQTMEPD